MVRLDRFPSFTHGPPPDDRHHMHMHRKRQPGGFAGTFDLARDAHAPERGEIALLEHDPKQERKNISSDRSPLRLNSSSCASVN